ncbi:ELC-like protein [Nymphaea thermarum]|nr:ELC-like protein [Nymphaea thermarum]
MVPPSYGLDSSQRYVQFLNKVLSARGPSALPYKEEVKWLIRQHLLSLLREFPSLKVKTAVFTHNDGRTVNILQAYGTIPMLYQRVTYNIPVYNIHVVIWLTKHYPRQYPCVFVNPMRDILIRCGAAHVDPSALVSAPYIPSWSFPSSNLVDLARNIRYRFGRYPPLCTRQPAPIAHRIDNQYQGYSSSTTVRMPSSRSPSSSASDHPPPSVCPSNVAPPSPPYGRTVPPSPRRANSNDPSEVLKKKLLEMLHSDSVALRKSREAETNSLVRAQRKLKRRGRQRDEGLRQMIDEKEGLEQLLQMVLMNTDLLETWLRENGKKNICLNAQLPIAQSRIHSPPSIGRCSKELSPSTQMYGLDSSQRSAQFLNKVLSARGPSALPYKEEVKLLIRQHLLILLQEFPSLQVKTAVFTHNDGRTVNLLQADGTIPMLYQQVTYNIPVVIWLTEHYPRQYPCVFVNPTRDMLIRPCHAYVDPSGLVSVPYMQSWTFPSSNLKKLLEMLHSDTVALRKSREEETDSLVRAQPELKRRGRLIDEGLRQMIDEKEGLEQLLQMVLMNTDVLETWLRENGEKNKLVIDVDDVFEPCDPLSRQMVDCTASDLAIEDTFYSLDKAMQQGVIPFDAYMRNIRTLSREQFFHRATSAKIRAAQMQSVITSAESDN